MGVLLGPIQERGKAVPSGDIGAGANSLTVENRRRDGVVFVWVVASDGDRQQPPLALECGLPIRRGHRGEVVQSRNQPPGYLRCTGSGQSDLVEGQADEAVPIQAVLNEAHPAAVIVVVTGGEGRPAS